MPEGVKPHDDILETDIDKLFNLVKRRRSITLSAAAKELGKTDKDIAEWGGILEKHKLVTLHYPIFGDPELRIVEKKKKEIFAEKGKGIVQEKKKPGKPLHLEKILGFGTLAVVLGFLAYVYYANTLYALNIRARIDQHLLVSREYVTSIAPALDGVFKALDSVFMGQFYLVLFPILLIIALLLIISPRLAPGKGRMKKRNEKQEKAEEKKSPSGESSSGKPENSRNLPGILKMLRR